MNSIFPSVIAQDGPKELLLRAIRSERMAHAYLFLGPAGCGKLPLALEMARVLNCPQGADWSARNECGCNSCRQMRQLATSRHPNLFLMFPLPPQTDKKKEDEAKAQETAVRKILETEGAYAEVKFASQQIPIFYVRDVIAVLSLMPDTPGTRVVIVFPANQMRDEAANAMLKLLEEPPDKCLLILIAESRRELLPTIVSRCQQIQFAPLSDHDVLQGLLRGGESLDRAAEIAPLAGGNFSWALQLRGEETEKLTGECLEFLRAAAVGNVAKASEWIDCWTGGANNRADLGEKIEFMQFWLQDALMVKAFGEATTRGLRIEGGRQAVSKMAARYQALDIERAIFELEQTRLALQANAMPALALSALAIKLHRVLI